MNEANRQNGTCAEPALVALNAEMDFEKALSQAINEGLSSISTIVAPVLRAYLDDAVYCEIGRMKARSTIADAKTLEKGLEKVFGFGAKVFERKILESLYIRLSLNLETRKNIPFSQAVKKAKEAFESRKRKNKKDKNSRRRLNANYHGVRKD